jgi:hypothetical protein
MIITYIIGIFKPMTSHMQALDERGESARTQYCECLNYYESLKNQTSLIKEQQA